MSPHRHKVQITLTNEIMALVQTEADLTGDSYASCIRRATRAFYDAHRKTSAYQANLDHLNTAYPEETA